MKIGLLCLVFAVAGCDNSSRNGHGDGSSLEPADLAGIIFDGPTPSSTDGGQAGCASQPQGCYTVYAHSNTNLYRIDLSTKVLVSVGAFNAPKVVEGSKMVTDVITDLAVAPDDTIYVISHTRLYTASATDGHVTLVGPITSCGAQAVALTSTTDGKLYTGDFQGAFCQIDPTASPPTVTSLGMIGSGLALSGDLVAVDDGTMYGTAYKLSDPAKTGTQLKNLLIKLDPTTGHVLQTLGSTGYPELFGVSFALGKVFGFTHDGSGDVVTIDPTTGAGTLFNTFNDPTTGKGISFSGAGVNSMVSPTIL